MKYDQGKPEELKEKFWKTLSDSQFVMLQLDADPDSAAPMTAQLDKDAHHAIWFFTSHDNRFAKQGPATATYSGKGHELFARFAGTLTEETDTARKDAMWNNFVEAWFPEGKASALMLRMDLADASIWSGEMGVFNTAKMMLGMNVRDDMKGGFAEVTL